MKTTKQQRLSDRIDELARLVPNGELHAATDPAELIRLACHRIETAHEVIADLMGAMADQGLDESYHVAWSAASRWVGEGDPESAERTDGLLPPEHPRVQRWMRALDDAGGVRVVDPESAEESD